MNTIKTEVSQNLTYNYILKTIFFYLFSFLLLYSEPITIGGVKIGILWKIILLAAILIPVSTHILKTKQIEVFVFFALLFSLKILFSISSFENINHTIGMIAKSLLFPMLFLFFSTKLNTIQLKYIAKHFSILIILSFVPFMLGILDPMSEGYKLESYGFKESFGLIGIFQKPHAASMSLAFPLIIIYYFFQNDKNKYMKFIYFGLLGLGIYELVLTYVRTGLLMVFIGIFYLWMKEKGSKKFVTVIIIVLPIIFMFSYMYATNPVFKMRIHDESIYHKKTEKIETDRIGSGRLRYAEAAIKNWYAEGFVSHAIGLGMGLGLIKMEQAVGMKIFAHNQYIQVLQQEGIIGALLFLLYLYSLLKYILRRKTNKYYFISMALFFAYIVEMAVQGGVMFSMALLMAIPLALMKKTETDSNELKVKKEDIMLTRYKKIITKKIVHSKS